MANDKSTDTVTTSLGGDTALSQTKESAAKIDNSSETAKENGGNLSVEDKIKAVSQQFGVDKAEVTSVPKAHGEIGGSEVLVTYDKKITPKQQELLRGLNFHEYPTIQELSAAKISNNYETAKENGEKFSLKDEKKTVGFDEFSSAVVPGRKAIRIDEKDKPRRTAANSLCYSRRIRWKAFPLLKATCLLQR